MNKNGCRKAAVFNVKKNVDARIWGRYEGLPNGGGRNKQTHFHINTNILIEQVN